MVSDRPVGFSLDHEEHCAVAIGLTATGVARDERVQVAFGTNDDNAARVTITGCAALASRLSHGPGGHDCLSALEIQGLSAFSSHPPLRKVLNELAAQHRELNVIVDGNHLDFRNPLDRALARLQMVLARRLMQRRRDGLQDLGSLGTSP